MKKYVASSPKAEVLGTALLAYELSQERAVFESILHDHGLHEIDPEAWYPQQWTLDIQRTIKETTGGMQALVSIGMKIIESAQFPPMNSLEEAIDAFAASYPMNFRNVSADDHIRAEMLGPGHVRVINASPHSDHMIYGYIYALLTRFAPAGSAPTVEFADLDKVDSDEDTVFNITWNV